MNVSGLLYEKRRCFSESCSILCVISSSLFFIHMCPPKRRKKTVCGLGCIFCYWDRWKFCMPNALMFTENKQHYTFLPCICTAPSPSHPCTPLALEAFCPTCMRLQAWVRACFLCPSEYEEVRTKRQRFFYFILIFIFWFPKDNFWTRSDFCLTIWDVTRISW